MTGSLRIILASQSAARRALLEQAGLSIDVHPAAIDEEAIAESLLAEGAKPRDIADALAEAKTRRLASKFNSHDCLVIGADQVLALDKEIFHKPESLEAARQQLMKLSGQTHTLSSAVCLARGGSVVWRYVEEAVMTMRPLSRNFIEQYLNRVGTAALTSVGAYQIEGLGAQLFSKVSGSHFSILGLPLLPLLDALRVQGALET